MSLFKVVALNNIKDTILSGTINNNPIFVQVDIGF